MKHEHYDLGVVGLGVMGRNFALNVAENGFGVVGYDLDGDKAERLRAESNSQHDVDAGTDLGEFLRALKRPRTVMMLVPAGDAVDSVLRDLTRHLDPGDMVIDAGNSHFVDTDRRASLLSEKGLEFLGTGVSGGEYGARHGPSIMPGGSKNAYARVEAIFSAAAARVDGDPCVAHLGAGSAGHYVKMVHNGIEYGIMQLIAEVYDMMQRGLGLSTAEMRDVFAKWNDGAPAGYLVEITARVLDRRDDRTGRALVDVIADAARQKGTGKWTSQDAMNLQVPTPTIDAAVTARNLSALDDQRRRVAGAVSGPEPLLDGGPAEWTPRLRDALYTGMLITYAQGFALIRRASEEYGYGVEPHVVARIWRGGCIIRAALLEDIRAVLGDDPGVENLLLTKWFTETLARFDTGLNETVCAAARHGLPAPAMAASLAYLHGYRSTRLPANLIQAQRDYFGSHTYERIDAEGTFHTEWRR